eukprot:GHVS01106365.1.p1 GENE.GHVS01106365.1~~GHVS01106365.1.p1  ORF type:complete len:639 (+),score=111.14 GHVS01106365.1:178-2094(+)
MSSSSGRVLVLDSGTCMLKCGWAGDLRPVTKLPNCIGQSRSKTRPVPFVSNNCYHIGEYFCHRPSAAGLSIDGDMQRDIWEHLFSKSNMNINPSETCLLLTEPFLSPPPIRHTLSEIIFEDFGFHSLLISPAQTLIPYAFVGYSQQQQQQQISGLTTSGRKQHISGGSGQACVGPTTTGYQSVVSPTLSYLTSPQLVLDNLPPSVYLSSVALSSFNGDDAPICEEDHVKQQMTRVGGNKKTKFTNTSHKKHKNKKKHNNNSAGLFVSTTTADKQNSSLLLDRLPTDLSSTAYLQLGPPSSPPTDFLLLPPTSSSQNPCCVSLDCGYSCCHCMCYYELCPIEGAALRTDLGGLHLNAYLKNLVNYRHTNLEHNDLLVQLMKEESCFVSQDFMEELKLAGCEIASSNRCHLYYEYELPDYNVHNKSILSSFFKNPRPWQKPIVDSPLWRFVGCDIVKAYDGATTATEITTPAMILQQQQECSAADVVLSGELDVGCCGVEEEDEKKPQVVLNNERICVPEILFNPQDVQVKACGVADLVYRTVCRAPQELQPFLCERILLVGGTSKLIGFKQRLWTELRKLFPQRWRVKVYQQEWPDESVWLGASQWASDELSYSTYCTTKQQFNEKGNCGSGGGGQQIT